MLQLRTPSPPLRPFVECLWLQSSLRHPPVRERVLPAGTVELVINLSSERIDVYDEEGRRESHGAAILSGARTRCFLIEPREDALLVGVGFRAGGAYPFLPVPVGEVRNRYVSMELLWGDVLHETRERLLSARPGEDRLRILERSLLASRRHSLAPDRAIEFALHKLDDPTVARVGDVAEAVGFSARHLNRRFDERVGLSPKQYQRVRRFQRALQLLATPAHRNLTRVALESGYYDQSHFVNEFRELGGLTPSRYLRERIGPGNHVPVTS